ncbi:MAG TPA: DUF2959 domain-containing protein [Steroidobacteraceae bacterium]
MRILASALACTILLGPLGGCQSMMYRALETVGIEKRDLLARRVSQARDSQAEAKEQFASALDQFRALVNVEGGDLERIYDRLNGEYEDAQSRAKEVSDRIAAVETVAGDLFAEWEDELDRYSDPNLRRDSQRLLSDTRKRYSTLIASMRRAERSMAPVLEMFEDRVLALKHNLNARAIGQLKGELRQIEQKTSTLMRDMERAISEADAFIERIRLN